MSKSLPIALLCLLTLALPGRAHAMTVTFDGPGGFGVSEATAQALGIGMLMDTIFAASSRIEVTDQDVQAFDLDGLPVTAASVWTVQNPDQVGPASIENGWLVFLTPLTYTPSMVGFDITPGDVNWRLAKVEVPDGEGMVSYYYPARFIGSSLDDGEIFRFLLSHVVGEPLSQQGNDFFLPQYAIGVIGAPEPSLVVLLLIAGGGVALTRRRRRC